MLFFSSQTEKPVKEKPKLEDFEKELRLVLLPLEPVPEKCDPGTTVDDIIRLETAMKQINKRTLLLAFNIGKTINIAFDSWKTSDKNRMTFVQWHTEQVDKYSDFKLKERTCRWYRKFFEFVNTYQKLKRLPYSIHDYQQKEALIKKAVKIEPSFWTSI